MPKAKKKQKIVEIIRSFSYKMSLPKYENRDFFCSQKAEATEKEAVKVSEALYKFCKKEVIKSVNDYKKEIEPKKTKPNFFSTYQPIEIKPIEPIEIPDKNNTTNK